ncbi:MAG TPA: DUF3179 domain-containing (seleno)protein [Candidatus Krumholzibacteria bacterium]|nr:DUF3179 domain-containing (seleno)protein [Candidatus Krumholzibacteria bacterium]
MLNVSWHIPRRAPRVLAATTSLALALASACDLSDTHVAETPIARIEIVDLDGRHWDITQAVVRYGFDPDGFRFGLGASKVAPFVLPRMAAAGDSGYPGPGDVSTVIGVGIAGPRAYRVDDLLDVEVVDDIVDGAPLALVVRPLLPGLSPSVHTRVVAGDTLTVSATGWVYEDQSVLFDFESGSLWFRLSGDAHLTCINGPHLTGQLPARAAAVGPWADWRLAHPQTLFMLRPPPSPPQRVSG